MANNDFDLPRPTDPVPSSSSIVANDNSKVLDYLVNGTGTVVTRTGKELTPFGDVIDSYGFGLADFTFAGGGVLTGKNLLVLGGDVYYKYIGTGSFPLTITAGTNPVGNSDWLATAATEASAITRGTSNVDNDLTSVEDGISSLEGVTAFLESRVYDNESDINALQLGQGSSVYGYATKALMDADLSPSDQSIAYVTNDATATNNGTYRKSGATGTGSWVQASTDLASQAYQLSSENYAAISDADLPELRETVEASLVRTYQLIDTFNLIAGYFVSFTTGNLQANPTLSASQFISIKPNTTYQMLECRYFTFYDANKVFISGSSTEVSSVVTPSNAAFIRVSILNTKIFNSLLAEGASPLPAVLYGSYSQGVYGLDDVNIRKDSISVNSVSFIDRSKNLFNKDTVTDGAYMTASGAVTAFSGLSLSDYIPVEYGETYYFNSKVGYFRFKTAFDADKNVIPSQGSDTAGQTEFTVASPVVKYVRITVSNVNENVIQLNLEQGASYSEYGNTLSSDVKVGAESVLFYENAEKTDNVFNVFTAVDGFAGPDGVFTSSTSYLLSDYISVSEGETYTYSDSIGGDMRFLTAYDSNLVPVTSAGSSVGVQGFTVPSGVSYYRITVRNDTRTNFMLAKTETSPEYAPYGYVVDDYVTARNKTEANQSYGGLKMVTFGDSITAQNMWQPYVAKQTGMYSVVRGVSGSPIAGTNTNAFWQDSRINTIDEDLDVLIIMGGTNDWVQNVPLGSPDSTNTSEFYGAFNVMMEKIMLRFSDARDPSDTNPVVTKPEMRIIINATPYGEIPSYSSENGDANVNGIGLRTGDYSEACRVMSKKWNTALCDVPVLCGWNTYNLAKFIKQDGGFLHPNSLGASRLASAVVGVLNSIPKLQ